MARPKEFAVEAALRSALELFWTNGYADTSLDTLLDATGLSRSSFYLAFGSKHALFLQCLDLYTQTVGAALGTCAAEPLPSPVLLDRLIGRVVQLTGGARNRGCFLGNTSLERGGRDAAARRKVHHGLGAIEGIFAEVLRRGVKEGSVHAQVDPKQTARILTSHLQGMLVMAKAGATLATLTALRRASLSHLTRRST